MLVGPAKGGLLGEIPVSELKKSKMSISCIKDFAARVPSKRNKFRDVEISEKSIFKKCLWIFLGIIGVGSKVKNNGDRGHGHFQKS